MGSFQPKQSQLQKQLEEARKKAQAQALVKTEETQAQKEVETKKEEPKFNFGTIEAAKDRIAIIADDSGSMTGEKITDARDGMIEFMRNCIPTEVACAVYPLNHDKMALTTNLPKLSTQISALHVKGCTPLFETLSKAQQDTTITRLIVFSDGFPDTLELKEKCISVAIERKTPIDTVLIADSGYSIEKLKTGAEYILLKEVADRTGGYFLVFQRGKVNFKTAFKYLSPGLRLMLAAENIRQDLQEGRLK